MADVFRSAPAAAPPAPRESTPDIRADASVHGRFLRLFGAISFGVGAFVALLFATVVAVTQPTKLPPVPLAGSFAVAGALVWLVGVWQRVRAAAVYRDGLEAPAEVVDVFQDFRVRMNGQNPWRVVYSFEAGGARRRGTATFWDVLPPRIAKGDRVTVLHTPGGGRSVLWTRVEPGALAPPPARVRIAAEAEELSDPESEETRARTSRDARG